MHDLNSSINKDYQIIKTIIIQIYLFVNDFTINRHYIIGKTNYFCCDFIINSMNRYLLKLAYNGLRYHGWQIQDNAHSVQAEISDKLSILLKDNISLIGCGRTDTGVHAKQFYAHFDFANLEWDLMDLLYKLNSFLPSDIVIYDLISVDDSFNSRFTALSRTYKYYISTVKDPFSEKVSYFFTGDLNIDDMNTACKYLLDYTDFTSFSKLHTQTATNNCKIETAYFEEKDSKLVFTITANRFLRNMVRAIMGTLLEIGKGRLPIDDMSKIIESKDRSKAGFSVPAHGLFLEAVRYPNNFQIS